MRRIKALKSEFKEDVRLAEGKLEAISNKYDLLTKDIFEAEARIKELKDQEDKAKEEVSQANRKKAVAKKNLSEVEQKFSLLQASVRDAESNLMKVQNLMEKETADYHVQSSILKESFDGKTLEFNNFVKKIKEDCVVLQGDYDQLKKKKDEISNAISGLEKKSKELISLEAECLRKQKELESIEMSYEKVKGHLDVVQKKAEDVARALKKDEKMRADITKELEKKEKSFDLKKIEAEEKILKLESVLKQNALIEKAIDVKLTKLKAVQERNLVDDLIKNKFKET